MAGLKEKDNQEKSSQLQRWLKRFGVGAFLFFLIKGLLWLLVFFGGVQLLGFEGC